MITRTSQPASGAMLISEMKEFASFSKGTQRYIRRSLDITLGRLAFGELFALGVAVAAASLGDHSRSTSITALSLRLDDSTENSVSARSR